MKYGHQMKTGGGMLSRVFQRSNVEAKWLLESPLAGLGVTHSLLRLAATVPFS